MRQLTQEQRTDVVLWYSEDKKLQEGIRSRYRCERRWRLPFGVNRLEVGPVFREGGSIAIKKHIFVSTPEKR